MQLQLQITLGNKILTEDIMDVSALFGVRYVTPGYTFTSDALPSVNWVRVEIDGSTKLSEKAYAYLQAHAYTLTFIKPPHEYTEEESCILDDEEYWR